MKKQTTDWDVIIVGAGLSGIGAACHLKKYCPQLNICLLESRERLGGTWDLFRYPGIRSDSDMYTLGYNFKPWTNPKAIADGDSILAYIQEAATEHRIDQLIRYQHKVQSCNWDSKDQQWSVAVQTPDGQQQLQSRFVFCCTGYYNYDAGYEPEFPNSTAFKGQIIHPQKWPDNFDYSNKKVVVIGSGATAVTLVPAMTDKAQHVTMLQRSPTYMASLPSEDRLLNWLRDKLPAKWAYHLGRSRNIILSMLLYRYTRTFPNQAKKLLLKKIQQELGPQYDLRHFAPSYNPWDERLCAVTDGDLFKAIKQNKAAVVTDTIAQFDETGVSLESGEHLDADIIVTATGLDVLVLGGIKLSIDQQPINLADKMCYKGLLFEDVPNLGMVFGYTNASWTLKSDLITEYFCRLLNYMDNNSLSQVTPRNIDRNVSHQPFVDMRSGYIQRAASITPKQGSKLPWKLYQNYLMDLLMLRYGKLQDATLEFDKPLATGNQPTT